MGQEFAVAQPFLYFADHARAPAHAGREGRREFLRQFPRYATPEAQAHGSRSGRGSDLPRREARPRASAQRTPHVYALHRDLLRLRREDPVIARQGRADGSTAPCSVRRRSLRALVRRARTAIGSWS